LVGVHHPVIRLYDVSTTQCFTGSIPKHQHRDVVTSVNWSHDGKLYVSASVDGCIKIWDGVSSHCVSTYTKAHDGHEVCSVQFTRNGKYVLSSGKDSLIKLWELSTNRCLIAYTGAGATGKQVILKTRRMILYAPRFHGNLINFFPILFLYFEIPHIIWGWPAKFWGV
jgi:cleavage stimulation factor subunit 1